MAATPVVGRDDELGSIQEFLAEVEQGPTALVLSGDAGIGKTTLWEAGVEGARERFGRVLSHRSVEAEASLAFGGLSDLLEPVLEDVAPALPRLRRRALEVALLLAEPDEEPPDPRAIGLAFLDALRLLAEDGPVLVALDDLQWLDSSSALVVPLALRRLRDEPVGLLATLRTGPGSGATFEVERSFGEERLTRLSLSPLTLGALHNLLRDRLALELTRPELGRVLETSGGNPFFALELGQELVRTDTRPEAGTGLPVPDSLRGLLGGRLARLPADTNEVLLHAAALARPTLELVAGAVGDEPRVLEGLDAAAREGVIEVDDARVRFANPLLASICYEQAPPWKRRAVHRRLADAVPDLEERARHLALAAEGPDTAAAGDLDQAAEQAAARGATAAAAELCELSAALTADDSPLVRPRLLRAADFHRLAGAPERAAAMLERLLETVTPGPERADVLFALAGTRQRDAPSMVSLCDEALAEIGGDDARSARLLAYRSWARMFEGDVRAALADARAALQRAERVGEPTLVAVAITRVAQAEAYAAELTPGLIQRGVEIEEGHGLSLEYYESPRVALTRALMGSGELDRARTVLEALEANAAARGDDGTWRQVLWRLSQLEWLAGRWQQALSHANVAHELMEESRDGHTAGMLGRARALIEADLGLVDEARASAQAGLAAAEAMSDEFFAISSQGVLGRLDLELGNLNGAADYLRDLPGRLLSRGLNEPTAPVWADAIETLLALGELELARDYLDTYALHAERIASPWAVAAAARCRGLLRAAEGDADKAFSAFEHALEELRARPFPLEQARTLLCLGTTRRQAGQKKAAREALEQALAIFDELGARLWAEKARRELRRISGRRAAADDLTETELRVAELAARGRSNKEIAAELFMGTSTVEMHLSRVYRKLGVRRAGLAARLATLVDAAKEA
jgi:ATP/maltotriose-dependent transcriptional regulator MalT